MAPEQNDKFKRYLIISVILHVVLIGFLIFGSLTQNVEMGGGGGGDVIDAVMVDPNVVAQQYDRKQQQQAEAQRAEKLRQQKSEQQAQELQARQEAEQKRLKEL
ncbi:MAG: cell envelope integrity protein TolA, partial [Enterobacteriaceae bacterium]